MTVYTKPCARGGCSGVVKVSTPSRLRVQRTCSHRCQQLARGLRISDRVWLKTRAHLLDLPSDDFTDQDLETAMSGLDVVRVPVSHMPHVPGPLYVPSPSNNVRHKRAQIAQLEAFAQYKLTAEYRSREAALGNATALRRVATSA
jgi:hypothetical protein